MHRVSKWRISNITFFLFFHSLHGAHHLSKMSSSFPHQKSDLEEAGQLGSELGFRHFNENEEDGTFQNGCHATYSKCGTFSRVRGYRFPGTEKRNNFTDLREQDRLKWTSGLRDAISQEFEQTWM